MNGQLREHVLWVFFSDFKLPSHSPSSITTVSCQITSLIICEPGRRFKSRQLVWFCLEAGNVFCATTESSPFELGPLENIKVSNIFSEFFLECLCKAQVQSNVFFLPIVQSRRKKNTKTMKKIRSDFLICFYTLSVLVFRFQVSAMKVLWRASNLESVPVFSGILRL